jgi:anti-sigma28 factor (negative regulator of flagellin synthesis)
MRIHDPNVSGLGGAGGAGGAGRSNGPQGAEGVGRSRGGVAPARSERSEDGDRIQLSGLSQELSAAEFDSPERLDRIDELRAAVRSGQYQPDAASVSKAIVADALGQAGQGPSGDEGGKP